MDDTGHTKYPVLFRVYVNSAFVSTCLDTVSRYGGPTYNLVSYRFGIDWHWYIACAAQLKYIVVMVDGRGTMYRGRKLRNPVRGNLGYWEARDQVNAAKCVAVVPPEVLVLIARSGFGRQSAMWTRGASASGAGRTAAT